MSVEFERLIKTLEGVLRSSLDSPANTDNVGPLAKAADGRNIVAGDAIDRELAAPARQTTIVSLRDTDAMNAFREELSDGLIRADTVNRVLQLVNDIVMKML